MGFSFAADGIVTSRGLGFAKEGFIGSKSSAKWFNSVAFADYSAVADFNRDRYAISTVPLTAVPTATVRELCVKRSCTFAEWFDFTCSSSDSRSYLSANGDWRNDLIANQPRFDNIYGRKQLAISAQTTNTCTSNNAGGVEGQLGGIGSGSLPTGWSYTFNASMTLTVSYLTILGLPICRIRVAGTPTSTGGQYINFEPDAVVTAGSSSAVSAFVALSAGSLSTVETQLRTTQAQSGPILVFDNVLRRYTDVRNITATNARCCIRFGFPDTVTPQDFTLDIAVPMREPGAAFVSEPIIGPAGTIRAVEALRASPLIEAIVARSAASFLIRGQNMLTQAGRLTGNAGSGSHITSTSNRLSFVSGAPSSLIAGNGSALNANSWAIAFGYDGTGRSIVRDGGTLNTDNVVPTALSQLWFSRNGSGSNFGTTKYDLIAIAPTRFSDSRLITEVVLP